MPNIDDSSTYLRRDSIDVDNNLKCDVHHLMIALASFYIAETIKNNDDINFKINCVN